MKRWPGESFEDFKARRANNDAITAAHLKGRLRNGQYVDPALHSMLTEESNLDKAINAAISIMMCVVSGGVGWIIGTFLYRIF